MTGQVFRLGVLASLLFTPTLFAQGSLQFKHHLGHYGVFNECATITPLTSTSTKADIKYLLKCPNRVDTFEATLHVEAPGSVSLLPRVAGQPWLEPTQPFTYSITVTSFKSNYDTSGMVRNYTGQWKVTTWVSIPGRDSDYCMNSVTGSWSTDSNTVSGSGKALTCQVDSLDPSYQDSVTAGFSFDGPGLFSSSGTSFSSFISVRTFYTAFPPTISDIKPSVAVNDPAADYAQKGSAKPLLATITGSNLPSSPKVSLGDGIQADVVSSTAAQIQVKLSGFGDLPEGPRSVTVTGSEGSASGGSNLFYVSSIRLAGARLEVNQGIPQTCSKTLPCVALHPTVIRARLTCAGSKTDGRPCESDKANLKAPAKDALAVPLSTGLLRVFQNGKESAASPFQPLSRMNILPAGQPADERLRILRKGMGQDSLDFYLSDVYSRLDLGEGKYDFVVEIDPRNPARPPRNSTLDENRNLVLRLSDQYFMSSNVSAHHSSQTGSRGWMDIGVIPNHNIDPKNNISPAKVFDYFRFLRAVYPLSYDHVRVRILSKSAFRDFSPTRSDDEEDSVRDDLEKTLNTLKTAGGDFPYTHLILLTDKITSPGLGHCRKENGVMTCRGRAVLINQNPSRTNSQTTVNVPGAIAHELGHNFGFGDTYRDPNVDAIIDSVNPIDKGSASSTQTSAPLGASRKKGIWTHAFVRRHSAQRITQTKARRVSMRNTTLWGRPPRMNAGLIIGPGTIFIRDSTIPRRL